MFCENCGGQIPDNSKFCRWCGKQIKSLEYTRQEQKMTESGRDKHETEACDAKSSRHGIIIAVFILIVIVIIGALIFFMSDRSISIDSGTDTDTEEVQITYDDLSEDEKEIIDLVYDNKDIWQSGQDSGSTYTCTYVRFLTKDGACVFYRTCKTSNGVFYAWYSFDVDTGEFEVLDSIYYQGGISSENFDVGWGTGHQKDVLAQEYISYLNSPEE